MDRPRGTGRTTAIPASQLRIDYTQGRSAGRGKQPEPVCSLNLFLPLPPTDNHCHASDSKGRRYATAAYKDWIERAGVTLKQALAGAAPDRVHYWEVTICLYLPARAGDMQNYVKPLLDLLSGAVVDKGAIQKVGGLWDDDRRIAALSVKTLAKNALVSDTNVYIQCLITDAPPTMKKEGARK